MDNFEIFFIIDVNQKNTMIIQPKMLKWIQINNKSPQKYVLILRKFMICDQDSILDHLQPSKLLDIWMHTQISRATRVVVHMFLLQK